jgi:2-methylcitrate dehydratase PrpD
MIEGLGSLWLTNENSFKPYACGLVIHPVIDGCLHIKRHHSFDAEKIEKISLLVNPLVLELTGKKQPVTGLEGKFSVHQSAAIVLLEGVSKSSQYSDAIVGGAEVTRLRDLVQIKSQPNIRIDEAHIEVLLSDGTKISHHVVHALGSLERPMTNQDIDEKYYDLTSSIMSKDQASKLLSDCWNVEMLDDVGMTLGKQLLFE